MDIDQQLRAQSKVLLQKLKARQGRLQNIVSYQEASLEQLKGDNFSSIEDKSLSSCEVASTDLKTINRKNSAKCRDHSTAQLDVSTTVVKPTGQRSTARCKLGSTSSNTDKDATSVKLSKGVNFNDDNHKQQTMTKDIEATEAQRQYKDSRPEIELQKTNRCDPVMDETNVKMSRTPLSVRQNRKIIDKNVKVSCDLNESEIDDRSRLNFSYSNFDDSDLNFMKYRLKNSQEEGSDNVDGNVTEGHRSDEEPVPDSGYRNHLQSAGNDRKVANFIRETRKPKSILLASGPKTLKKSLNKVSFLGSQNSSSSVSGFSEQRQLLGYDWIAALLDNDRGVMDQSEGYFEELKEFRRINRDECVNNYFMEGADTLLAERDHEPPLVAEALSDTKVKPYTVTDRLFTEPMKQRVFESDDTSDDCKNDKTPTLEEPRFVRVSIPRSTLLSPHRVKPHRRKSIDDADSFALSTHCVKGYENSIPSMVPAASNIGLRDASLGLKSKMQTTLADAEKVAASFPYPWTSTASSNIRQPIRTKDESALYKSYQDMALPSALQFCGQGDLEESGGLKKATEDLLNSTYSLMYGMEKIRQQRDTVYSRRLGHVA